MKLPKYVIVVRSRHEVDVMRSAAGIATASRDVPPYLSEVVATCKSIDDAAKVANALNAGE